MQKKILIAALAVIVLAAAGWFGAGWFEKRVEANIYAELQHLPPEFATSYGSVKYSFFADEIVFTDVKSHIEFADYSLNCIIKTIRVRNPNLDVFQGTARPGMVAVADRLSYENIHMVSEDGSIIYEIKNGFVNDWRMDAHALREAFINSATLAKVFGLIMDSEFRSSEYIGLSAKILLPGMPGNKPLTYSVEQAVAEHAKNQRLGALRASNINYSLWQTEVNIAELSMKGLHTAWLAPLLDVPPYHAVGVFPKLLADNPLLEGIELADLSITVNDGQRLLHCRNLRAESAYEPVYTHRQSLSGLSIYREGLGAGFYLDELMDALYFDVATFDAEFSVRWAEAGDAFSIEQLDITLQDGGKLSMSQHFKLQGATSPFTLLNPYSGASIQLESAELLFADNSLMSRGLDALAEDAHLPPEEILNDAVFRLDDYRERARYNYNDESLPALFDIYDALEDFLLAPGTLHVTIKPETPLDPRAVPLAFLADPSVLHITVNSTRGEALLDGYQRPAPYDPKADNGWEEPGQNSPEQDGSEE